MDAHACPLKFGSCEFLSEFVFIAVGVPRQACHRVFKDPRSVFHSHAFPELSLVSGLF